MQATVPHSPDSSPITDSISTSPRGRAAARHRRFEREDRRRQPALHIADAAPIEPPVTLGRGERLALPTLRRDFRHIDMPVEQQRSTGGTTRPAQAADHIGIARIDVEFFHRTAELRSQSAM